MKIILRFPEQDKIKEIPTEITPPKIVWTQTEPEIHHLIAQMQKEKQAEAMDKYGENRTVFVLSGEEDDDIPVYLPASI